MSGKMKKRDAFAYDRMVSPKNKNRDREFETNLIFEHLRGNGFNVYDVLKENGYFIFDFGEEQSVLFRVRELKGWHFGLWLRDNDVIHFFVEHDLNRDKFKPSRCSLRSEIDWRNLYGLDDDRATVDWELSETVKICRYIKHHYFEAFCDDHSFGDHKDIPSYFGCFVRSAAVHCKYALKGWLKDVDGFLYGHLCKLLYSRRHWVKKFSLVACQKKWRGKISPRYEILVEVTDETAADIGMIPNREYTCGIDVLDNFRKHNGHSSFIWRQPKERKDG